MKRLSFCNIIEEVWRCLINKNNIEKIEFFSKEAINSLEKNVKVHVSVDNITLDDIEYILSKKNDLNIEVFRDIYYDNDNMNLGSKNMWLRKRTYNNKKSFYILNIVTNNSNNLNHIEISGENIKKELGDNFTELYNSEIASYDCVRIYLYNEINEEVNIKKLYIDITKITEKNYYILTSGINSFLNSKYISEILDSRLNHSKVIEALYRTHFFYYRSLIKKNIFQPEKYKKPAKARYEKCPKMLSEYFDKITDHYKIEQETIHDNEVEEFKDVYIDNVKSEHMNSKEYMEIFNDQSESLKKINLLDLKVGKEITDEIDKDFVFYLQNEED